MWAIKKAVSCLVVEIEIIKKADNHSDLQLKKTSGRKIAEKFV